MNGSVDHVARDRDRWGAIDATRGVAMGMVWLSHFLSTYFRSGTATLFVRLIKTATLVATPTFILVSGVMLGWISTARRMRPIEIWRRAMDRALFLIIVAHPLIFLAHVPLAGGLRAATRMEYVTDTIAVCLVIAPGVILTIGRRGRIGLGAALFAASWYLVTSSHRAGLPTWITEVLVGAFDPQIVSYSFPIAQWFGVYIVGTALGEELRVVRERSAGQPMLLPRRAGLSMLLGGLVLYIVHVGVRPVTRQVPTLVFTLTAPGQKLPPGPAYVLVFGGLGLLLFAAIAELERKGMLEGPRRLASLVGRNSLFAFTAQYFVYYTAVILLRPTPTSAWPLWFLLSAVVLLGAVLAWDRGHCNRWLTVGMASHRVEAAQVNLHAA